MGGDEHNLRLADLFHCPLLFCLSQLLCRRIGHICLGKLPVGELVDKGFQKAFPVAFVIEIIGMLPQVAGQQRSLAVRQR